MPLDPVTLDKDFFAAETVEVARALLGTTLVYRECAGVIVEVEAYKGDAASHFVTRRHKGAMMGDTFGQIYIYQIYGMHYCLNITTDAHGPGAVLLRALAPVCGLEAMRRRRGVTGDRALASGPAKLFVALGLDPKLNGRVATEVFTMMAPDAAPDIAAGPRIGITKAADLPWRFHVRGSPWVSHK